MTFFPNIHIRTKINRDLICANCAGCFRCSREIRKHSRKNWCCHINNGYDMLECIQPTESSAGEFLIDFTFPYNKTPHWPEIRTVSTLLSPDLNPHQLHLWKNLHEFGKKWWLQTVWSCFSRSITIKSQSSRHRDSTQTSSDTKSCRRGSLILTTLLLLRLLFTRHSAVSAGNQNIPICACGDSQMRHPCASVCTSPPTVVRCCFTTCQSTPYSAQSC